MDEDIDDEEEAPEIDDEEEEEPLAEAICLVAITKDTQTEVLRCLLASPSPPRTYHYMPAGLQPLFIECHMDRFGIQVNPSACCPPPPTPQPPTQIQTA